MTKTPSKAEIEKLAAEHLKAFSQFPMGGQVWFEGEVEFARIPLRIRILTNPATYSCQISPLPAILSLSDKCQISLQILPVPVIKTAPVVLKPLKRVCSASSAWNTNVRAEKNAGLS